MIAAATIFELQCHSAACMHQAGSPICSMHQAGSGQLTPMHQSWHAFTLMYWCHGTNKINTEHMASLLDTWKLQSIDKLDVCCRALSQLDTCCRASGEPLNWLCCLHIPCGESAWCMNTAKWWASLKHAIEWWVSLIHATERKTSLMHAPEWWASLMHVWHGLVSQLDTCHRMVSQLDGCWVSSQLDAWCRA